MLVPEKITEVSKDAPPKAASPIDVTFAGIVTEVRPVPLNALRPMDVTLVGIELVITEIPAGY